LGHFRPVPTIPGFLARRGFHRWWICALLLLATTVNYVDRMTLSLLAPDLQAKVGWSEAQYGYINAAFKIGYAAGILGAGALVDRLGTRLGYALAVSLWSLAAMAHALARSALGFGAARCALGLAEGGNFPAAIKTVAEWFPRRERAFATGIFNAGTNLGAVIAPLAVPGVALAFGWPWAFLATGAIGFLWLILWIPSYRKPEDHPRLSPVELAWIRSDPPDPPAGLSWRNLLRHRQTWAFALGKFLTDPIWWFYLFWLPKFLAREHGLTLDRFGVPIAIVYLVADGGSVGGGWLSSSLLRRGWSTNGARKTAMLACALCVVPVAFAANTSHLGLAVGLIALAAAAHQGWSANLFTLASDLFPRRAVGSVVGVGGAAGALGGVLLDAAAGNVLEWTGSYAPLFVLAATAYLVGFAVIHALAPRLEPARVGPRA
jgi:ACS family hexuronate transporter-like MFS transporter